MTGLDMIKLCFFFSLSLVSSLCAFKRVHWWVSNDRVWITLSACHSCREGGKKAFSGLSSSSLCDKRLLCSTHTVGRPLTGLLQLAGRGLSVSELTRTEIWQKKDKMTTFSWIFEQPAFQATVCKVGPLFRISAAFKPYLVSDSGDRGTFSVDQRDLWRWAAATIRIFSASALTTTLSQTHTHRIRTPYASQ